MLCKFGCGQEAAYKDRCDKYSAKCPAIKKKNSEGLKRAHREHPESYQHKLNGHTGWNKGLTKDTDERVRRIGESYSRNIRLGITKPSMLGKHLSCDQRKKLSEAMKKAHAEGRAWNIGKSRWNNEKSWPEKFFEQVINNEFDDKNYKTEHAVGIYSIDFAWPDKMKAIEIDGDQHQRFEEYKERDARKDIFLKEKGWQILRIVWKEMYKDTKEWIKIAKEFIDN